MKTIRMSLPVWLYGFFPAFCCLLKGLSDRLYTDIDSYLISITCAGLYSKDAFCPVVHPLLSMIVGFLSKLWSGADWFSVLSQTFVVAGIWWLGTLLSLCITQRWKRLACLLILCFALLQFSLFNINFTVYAGFFAFLGIGTLLLSLRVPLPFASHLIAAFFLSLSILWRSTGAALFIPFLFLDLSVLCIRHTSIKRIAKLSFPCILSVAVLGVLSFSFYNLPGRNSSKIYSEARSTFFDYPNLPWEEVDDQLLSLGISENDYNTLSAGILLDTDLATADTLQEVSSLAKAPSYEFSLTMLPSYLSELPGVFSTPLLRILCLFSLVLLLHSLASQLPLLEKVEALLALGGAGIICLYYQYLGRLPERVAACVLLALLAVLLPLFLCTPSRQGKLLHWFWRVACAVAGCTLCLCLWKNRYSYHILQPALLAGATESENQTTCDFPEGQNSNSVYLWNSTTLALYMTDHYLSQGKMPNKDFVQHNLPWGEWNTSGQPFYQNLLSELGMENPMQSLLTRSETYLVCNDMTLVQTWLQEHYDSSATFRQIGTVEVFAMGEVPIWQACTDSGV